MRRFEFHFCFNLSNSNDKIETRLLKVNAKQWSELKGLSCKHTKGEFMIFCVREWRGGSRSEKIK